VPGWFAELLSGKGRHHEGRRERRSAKFAVIDGGASAERQISLMSGTGVLESVAIARRRRHAFDPSEARARELKHEGFARCFIRAARPFGEDGSVQGALELLRIPTPAAGVPHPRSRWTR